MKKETDRVKYALKMASEGTETALICSGDSGVYGMAGLALELSADYPNAEITIVPGITAALSRRGCSWGSLLLMILLL